MVTVSDVVRPLLNEHGETHWKTGVVLAVDTAHHWLTVAFVGAASGAGTPRVGYVDGYTPQVNHIVHCLIAETRGALAIGSTGSAPAGWNSAVMALRSAGPTAAPDAVSDPARSGTLVDRPGGKKLLTDLVKQGPGHLGVWGMPDLAGAISNARTLGVITRIEIEVTMLEGGPRAVLVLLTNEGGAPVISAPERRSDRLETGVPTRVALPIGWLDSLELGTSMIGLSNRDAVSRAAFDTSASVYLTVETV